VQTLPATSARSLPLLIDADNHYYEPDDCFSRYIERSMRSMAVNVRRDRPDGLGRIYIGDRRVGFVSVMPADHVNQPGALRPFFEGRVSRAELEGQAGDARGNAAYFNREVRLKLMDDQGVEAAILLPSLGVAVEYELSDDVEVAYANLRAFNRWVEADWGFHYRDRIFGVPMLSLLSLERGIEELERVLGAGARVIHLRPGPVHGRSPADPYFDPFWTVVQEAGVPVALHVGDAGYNEMYSTLWGEPARPPAQSRSAFQIAAFAHDRPIMDTLAALVLHNLFGRFPGLDVISIENGSTWTPYLLHELDKAKELTRGGRWPGGYVSGTPSDVFRSHVHIVPFYEDDLGALVKAIGVDQVVFGSDYPHPEGLSAPSDFLEFLTGFPDSDVRAIVHDNASKLLKLAQTSETSVAR
jgi:predicted TIM-barrel fold metal-dependent hydrolase